MDSIPSQILLQIVLILLNAFFASAEIAVISLNVPMLRKSAEEGDKKAKSLLRMAEEPAGFLSTIQIGITMAGFLGSAFAAENFSGYLVDWIYYDLGFQSIGMKTLDTISVVIITCILSYFTLIFGELVPKRIAMQKSYQVAKLSCGVIRGISVVMKPIISFLSLSTNAMLRLLHMKTEAEEEEVTEDEIRLMVDLGEKKGILDQKEKEWIENVFELGDSAIRNVMVHAPDVVKIALDEDREEILKIIQESGLSRFPVYQDTPENIVGILNAKDFLLDLQKGGAGNVKKLLRTAYFVPENMAADRLFHDMQKKKVHFAVVVDEFGMISGIITIEDLLEEIVGNIYDEYDSPEEQPIVQTAENKWKVLGNVEIDELEEVTGIRLNPGEDYETLNGFVYYYMKRIPEDGDSFKIPVGEYNIIVDEVKDRKVSKAWIEKKEPVQELDKI
ncbi:hemolysin family protein [Lachnoclostridium sp. An181]|uniref:hemolysin family protein n=1 Tax=Lachnoclostridium sp. An181 TaxID=1965575 RepID=UPI000B3A3EA0|nr:hemolysin family protein [Lachnoclostridium sp. An181]OUP49810.1 hemolysin [Lachnoclostridium sp. An181]